jgi:hypothetical protein
VNTPELFVSGDTPEIFVIGAMVPLIVSIALGLLIYGAILDSRDARRARRDTQEGQDLAGPRSEPSADDR